MRAKFVILTVLLFSGSVFMTVQAAEFNPSAINIVFQATHGPQGTGNYKGKRDRHEKPGPMNERKKKGGKWKWLRR